MRLQRQSNKQIVTIDVTSTLGHGGEARVYAVPQDETLVAKVYHKATDLHAQKLKAMLINPPENPTAGQGHISIAWPIDLLRTADGSDRLSGFLMPRVKGMHSLLDFYNPKTRRQKCPFFNHRYLLRTARNLAAAVGALHVRGYCVGDVNESNILVSDTALITLVDTDSFQVRNSDKNIVYRCPVGKVEFTPPELQGKNFQAVDRTIEHDLFGLAVLIFQLLMEGTHPFSGVFQGSGDPPPYETRIASGHFCYSTRRHVPYVPTPIAPPFKILHPSLQQLFIRCFEDGHKNPQMRPSAQTWQAALNEAEKALVTCTVNNQHRYGNHLNTCPWCDRTIKLGGRDPFPSLQAVQKGHHLQPIPTRRKTQQTSNRVDVHNRRAIITKQTPLLAPSLIKKTKKGLIPVIFGLSIAGILTTLEIIVLVKDIKLPPQFSTAFFSRNNDHGWTNQQDNLDRSSHAYYLKQGTIHYKLGDYEGAIENFNQAINLNPKNARAYINRGNTRYQMAQNSPNPDAHQQAAIVDFNQALRLNPNAADAYVSLGMINYEIAQYSKDPELGYKSAIADFNKALQRNPQNSKAYLKRGIVYYKLAKYTGDSNNNYKQAIKDFSQALSLNPNDAKAYVNRGNARYEVAQYNGGDADTDSWEALKDLQKAAKLFLEQGDIDQYQQALSSICVALESNCDSFLLNPDKFIKSGSPPVKINQLQDS